MTPASTTVSERAVRGRAWQSAVEQFGRSLGCSPPRSEAQRPGLVEIGVVGLSGVGKSSLLNALVAPAHELLPSGGVGPLTGVPVHVRHARTATLRVKYVDPTWLLDALARLDGDRAALSSSEIGRLSLLCAGDQYAARDPVWLGQAIRYALQPDTAMPPADERRACTTLRSACALVRRAGTSVAWETEVPDGVFFRRVHEHIAGASAALCERIEIGWPSAMLESGAVLVDLPGLGMVSDTYSPHTSAWLERARAVAIVVDRAGIAESIVTCLRRCGFLNRVITGEADLFGIVTKLDQVADDVRRRDGATQSWARCFRAVARCAETEFTSQIAGVLRYEEARPGIDPAAATPLAGICVFGVSSREHGRVVQADPDDRPRLHIPESSGIPAVRRALAALACLRSDAGSSAVLDCVRRCSDAAARLPELFSLVDVEGL
jgi:hypothetical protein